MEVYDAANADAQVDGCPNESEHEVIADACVYRPGNFDLFRPKEQQPGHDDEHEDPDEELDGEVRCLDEVAPSLRT